MAAPFGNKNAVGHNGSNAGRKSYAQEVVDVQFLHDIFFEEISYEEVRRKIAMGTYSVKDIFIKMGLEGNTKVITSIFKKLFSGNTSANQYQDKEYQVIISGGEAPETPIGIYIHTIHKSAPRAS